MKARTILFALLLAAWWSLATLGRDAIRNAPPCPAVYVVEWGAYVNFSYCHTPG
jgi:hypothetical protein